MPRFSVKLMNLKNYLMPVFFIASLCIFPIISQADTRTSYIPSDRDVLEFVSDVIEGTVVKKYDFREELNQCFFQILDLRVERSLRREFEIDQVIRVGINIEFPVLDDGSIVIVAVDSVSDSFYENCKFTGDLNRPMLTSISSKMGIFEVVEKTSVLAYRTKPNVKLFLEHTFSQSKSKEYSYLMKASHDNFWKSLIEQELSSR